MNVHDSSHHVILRCFLIYFSSSPPSSDGFCPSSGLCTTNIYKVVVFIKWNINVKSTNSENCTVAIWKRELHSVHSVNLTISRKKMMSMLDTKCNVVCIFLKRTCYIRRYRQKSPDRVCLWTKLLGNRYSQKPHFWEITIIHVLPRKFFFYKDKNIKWPREFE